MTGRTIIIDGYNLMQRVKGFGRALDDSLESARRALIGTVGRYLARKRLFDKTVIVFDGARNMGEFKNFKVGAVSVVFSAFRESADDRIISLIKKAAPPVRVAVVSDDNYVTNNARAHGADIISCADFMALAGGGKDRVCHEADDKKLDDDTMASINDSLKKAWRIK